MAVGIKFQGGEDLGFKPGHSYPTAPLTVPRKVRAARDRLTGDEVVDPRTGESVTRDVLGWEVGDIIPFDRYLAEEHGRSPENDGEDFARLHLEAINVPYRHLVPQVDLGDGRTGPDPAKLPWILVELPEWWQHDPSGALGGQPDTAPSSESPTDPPPTSIAPTDPVAPVLPLAGATPPVVVPVSGPTTEVEKE